MLPGAITNRVGELTRRQASLSTIVTDDDFYTGITDIRHRSVIMRFIFTATENYEVDPVSSFFSYPPRVLVIRAAEIHLKDLKLCKGNVAQTKQRHKTAQKHQFLRHLFFLLQTIQKSDILWP
jgi:hypothetical protein